MKLICNLCELPLAPSEAPHIAASGNVYCGECWKYRDDEVHSIEEDNLPSLEEPNAP